MSDRKYTTIVTVTLVSPEGKHIGSGTESLNLDLDMSDFLNDNTVADNYMKTEVGSLLSLAAANIEGCF